MTDEYELSEWDADYEHPEECDCEACRIDRYHVSETEAANIWAAEQATLNHADNLMGGALSEEEE